MQLQLSPLVHCVYNFQLEKETKYVKKIYKVTRRQPHSFRNLRFVMKSDVKCGYKDHLQKGQNSPHNDPRGFWAFVNRKKSINRISQTLMMDNHTFDSPQDIVDAFALYFQEVSPFI